MSPNYFHSYYNVVFFLFFVSGHVLAIINTHILASSEYLSSNRSLVSLGDDFELGFFKISGDNLYLGIWYKKIPERTYVWIANRDNPITTSTGTLKISGNNLVLLQQSNIPVWSTNLIVTVRTPAVMVAELLPTGNFVLRDTKTTGQSLLWQSFDYPTDTLLPRMMLGVDRRRGNNKFLTSWKNSHDPSNGDYSFKLESLGLPEFVISLENVTALRYGPWDGQRFSGMPEMQLWHEFNIFYNFTENKDGAAFSFGITTPKIYARLVLTYQGLLQLSTIDPTTREWVYSWSSENGRVCNSYGFCAPYAYCDTHTSPLCNCFKGFGPRNLMDCDRKTPLSCNGDGFLKLSNMKLPDTIGAIVDRGIGLRTCEERCRMNCNCTGYANTNIQDGGSGCIIWTGVLNDIKSYADAGQDIYVKLAASDLAKAHNNSWKSRTRIGVSVGASALLFLSFIMLFIWRRRHIQSRTIGPPTSNLDGRRRLNLPRTSEIQLFGEEENKDFELLLMEYDTVAMATNDFSNCNKLGQGGFGTVYKGRLPDGQEIAVKRLSKVSTQGIHEFKTELMLIARLQHINLVRLLGYYADADEKILVYEYMENLSLDNCLIDITKSCELNWEKRFDIIKGIARGLLYLHQDSRCRVIHRDLKSSNILLDKDMIPKISDFGMATIFSRDKDEATTRRIVGTYGYMSPEYATHGLYSEKSDVFSFGVLILEIISGQRNRGFTSHQDIDLLNYVWRNMEEGTWHAIIDPKIIDLSSYRPVELLRCVEIGLTCVQEYAEHRPTMSWVVLVLGSETEAIYKPGPPPAYSVRRSPDTESSSPSTAIEYSISEITTR